MSDRMIKRPNSRLKDRPAVYVQRRHHYGRERIYPVCDLAETLCQLTGRKTFRDDDIRIISSMGYLVEYVPESVDIEHYKIVDL